jgi:hypothetical protein
MEPQYALVSYNGIYGLNGTYCFPFPGIPVLYASHMFTDPEKCPEAVHEGDKEFKIILKHRKSLKKIFIFIGKRTSGAVDMVELFCRIFANDKDRLVFVLCGHDREEKEKLLKFFRVSPENWKVFDDNHEQCRESAPLMGHLTDYLIETGALKPVLG